MTWKMLTPAAGSFDWNVCAVLTISMIDVGAGFSRPDATGVPTWAG
jgi:hypothetical protein